MTPRAVDTLNAVDAIFCEDTRHSQVLFNHFNIQKPTYSYHKFNERESLDFVLSFVAAGKDLAVISDAGMPCINDPGAILVAELKRRGLPYTVVSGPSAFVNAFVLSGYTPPFTYVGFLPEKTKDRQSVLASVNTNGVLIFYVSVHDIADTFAYLYDTLGDRNCCLVKELTKLHEKVIFCTLADVPQEDKGEFVLVVDRVATENALNQLPAADHVQFYIDSGLSKNDAIKQAAKDRGVPKNDIYKLLI
jgi:16S rRNA (cytidine1402-2'-O)-methyltransferase